MSTGTANMQYESFPRWTAPFVTPALAGAIAYWVSAREGRTVSWTATLVAAGIGFFVGLLIAVADTPAKKKPVARVVWKAGVGPTLETPPELETEPEAAPESMIGPFLSLLAILLFCAPVIGFVLSCLAVFECRKRVGWPKTLSRVAFVLSLFITLVCVVMMIFARD
jgi:MFS family permease